MEKERYEHESRRMEMLERMQHHNMKGKDMVGNAVNKMTYKHEGNPAKKMVDRIL